MSNTTKSTSRAVNPARKGVSREFRYTVRPDPKGGRDAWRIDVSGGPRGDCVRRRERFTGSESAAQVRAREIARDLGFIESHDRRTLADVFECYMRDYAPANNLAAATIKGYRIAFNLYLGPAMGSMDLESIDLATIDRFKADMLNRGYAPGNINRQLQHLQTWLGYAANRLHWIKIETVPECKRLTAQTNRHVWRAEDVTAIVRACGRMSNADKASECVDGAVTLLGLHCGLRVGEVIGLQRRNVHLSASAAYPYGHVTVANSMDGDSPTKGRKVRDVPLSPASAHSLRCAMAAVDMEDFALGRETSRGWAPLSQSACKGALDRVLKSANLWTGEKRRLAGMHSLRHTFATILAESGMPVPALSRLLGHASVKTTLVYLHGIGTGGATAEHMIRVFSATDRPDDRANAAPGAVGTGVGTGRPNARKRGASPLYVVA